MIKASALFFSLLFGVYTSGQDLKTGSKPNNLPSVLPKNHAELVSTKLRFEAALKSGVYNLPDNLKDWETYSNNLKNIIIRKAGVVVDHKLPLILKETGRTEMNSYSVRNVLFQTRPGIFATANLYVPNGKGPFPGVICMLGHWDKGKIDSTAPQAVGHSLASNGYVCLTIDPWGSGERSTIHGVFEDHGDENNLGSALMNIGEPLIGIEISDNIRGVDLLCSLPYVDSEKIGATGASGGGNQTMWLTCMDERIKVAMPVVSAGTFEAHVMGSPCICEVLPGALTYTEEAGILALIAPRALKLCNHKKDGIPAFLPSEMIRSYNNARIVYKMYGVENNLTYEVFDLPHGYKMEDRQALLGWFDLHLKGTGTGASREEIPFRLLPEEKLMVFPKEQKNAGIMGTAEYCIKQGAALRSVFMSSLSIDTAKKRNALREILGIKEIPAYTLVHKYSTIDGWNRIVLETTDNKLIPLLMRPPAASSTEFVIVTNPEGKAEIPGDVIEQIIASGKGIVIADLSGTGEASSNSIAFSYKAGKLRVISRSELWFGRTILGEWVKELNIVTQFLKSEFKGYNISVDGSKETGVAGLFLGALEGKLDNIILHEAPVSYLFDTREGIEFFSNGIHVPDFLKWGDVSLAAALSGKNIVFINPVSMSGNRITGEKLSTTENEFAKIRSVCHQPGKTVFK